MDVQINESHYSGANARLKVYRTHHDKNKIGHRRRFRMHVTGYIVSLRRSGEPAPSGRFRLNISINTEMDVYLMTIVAVPLVIVAAVHTAHGLRGPRDQWMTLLTRVTWLVAALVLLWTGLVVPWDVLIVNAAR